MSPEAQIPAKAPRVIREHNYYTALLGLALLVLAATAVFVGIRSWQFFGNLF